MGDGSSSEEAAEARFQAQVRRDLPRNFFAPLCHGMLGQCLTPIFSATLVEHATLGLVL